MNLQIIYNPNTKFLSFLYGRYGRRLGVGVGKSFEKKLKKFFIVDSDSAEINNNVQNYFSNLPVSILNKLRKKLL